MTNEPRAARPRAATPCSAVDRPAKPSARLAASAVLILSLLIVSGIAPYDRLTWLMETMPVLIALPVLVATYRRYPLTLLLYGAIAVYAVVLIVGAHFTYARVPLGHDLADWLGLARNPYDRIGHLAQGFIPAMVVREILRRTTPLNGRRMLAFVVLCIVLAVSATYELIEWAAAVVMGQGADEFLGTQGDPWDTQWDMFCALLGGATALLGFARWHDRQLRALCGRPR